VKVQLVLVGFGDVQNLHVAALHPHSQPLACRTVAQREDLEMKRGRRGQKVKNERWSAIVITSSSSAG